MNDFVHLAMRRATEAFGGRENGGGPSCTFNSACFSKALMYLAQLDGLIEGELVEVILYGRDDVVQLPGGAHWRLIENAPQP